MWSKEKRAGKAGLTLPSPDAAGSFETSGKALEVTGLVAARRRVNKLAKLRNLHRLGPVGHAELACMGGHLGDRVSDRDAVL